MMKTLIQEDTGSETDEEAPRMKGTSEMERVFVIASAQGDQGTSDDDISIDSESARTYKRRYKRHRKKQKLWRWGATRSPAANDDRHADVLVEVLDARGQGNKTRKLISIL